MEIVVVWFWLAWMFKLLYGVKILRIIICHVYMWGTRHKEMTYIPCVFIIPPVSCTTGMDQAHMVVSCGLKWLYFVSPHSHCSTAVIALQNFINCRISNHHSGFLANVFAWAAVHSVMIFGNIANFQNHGYVILLTWPIIIMFILSFNHQSHINLFEAG